MLQTINTHSLIDRNDKIVVAVSGGADSVALLHGLHAIKDTYNLELFVCHLNHQLRGEDADGDACYVKELSDGLAIQSYIYSRDVASLSKEMKMSFEETAREIRYALFDEVLLKTGATKIAVAQNMNDQAETILMRLFRGSGLEGLTATKFKRDTIIRPILAISREDIESYCLQNQLNFRTDHTNFETDYSRNKIRLELLPYVKEHFNEKIIEKLFDTTQLLSDDLKFIEKHVDDIYNKCVLTDRVLLSDLDLDDAILSRVLRKIIDKAVSLKGISSEHIKELMTMVKLKKHGNERKVKTLTFEISYDKLLFFGEGASGLEMVSLDQSIDYNGYRLEKLEVINKRDIHTITIDADKLKGKLTVRTRKPGDRFSPLNMKGSKKLKDFFIDLKIPVHERDNILLLCDEGQIIWVVGYRLSDLYKVDERTENKISFKLSKIPD